MSCLHESQIEWLDEPYDIPNDEVVPGMVFEVEYGDFDNWVQGGVLAHGRSAEHPNRWYTYAVRVVRNDWEQFDEMYGADGGGVRLVGYFDVDAFIAENPGLDLDIH